MPILICSAARETAMADDIDVIAPNLNRRLSGVTSTIVRLVPLQRERINITSYGVGLPDGFPKLSFFELLKIGNRQKPIIFHARRNVEMLLGIFLKHVLRKNLKLLFTSASQRKHSGYTKFLINRMDRIIATSNAGSQYLEHDCDVVYHGINVDDFSTLTTGQKKTRKNELKLPAHNLIGCFGRIRKQKGTDVFIDTMTDVLPNNPDWSAIIMGRATEEHQGFLKEQKEKIERAGLGDRIIFAGEVPVDQIASYYQCLSLFIAPQRWEGFGLTPLEAMACGVPVVATKVGAFPEIVLEGKTGHLIERGDVGEMIEATQKLLNNKTNLNTYAKASRKHMEDNFRIEKEANRLVDIYEEMLAS